MIAAIRLTILDPILKWLPFNQHDKVRCALYAACRFRRYEQLLHD